MSDQNVAADVSNPEDFRARQNATALMAAIELKLSELSDMLEKVPPGNKGQRLLIKTEMAAQSFHHRMIRHDCEKKGWL